MSSQRTSHSLLTLTSLLAVFMLQGCQAPKKPETLTLSCKGVQWAKDLTLKNQIDGSNVQADSYPFSKLYRLKPTIHPTSGLPSYIIVEKGENQSTLRFEPGINRVTTKDGGYDETKNTDVNGDLIQGHLYQKSINPKNNTTMIVKVDIEFNTSTWKVSEKWDDQYVNNDSPESLAGGNHTEFSGSCQPSTEPF